VTEKSPCELTPTSKQTREKYAHSQNKKRSDEVNDTQSGSKTRKTEQLKNVEHLSRHQTTKKSLLNRIHSEQNPRRGNTYYFQDKSTPV